ncbi:DUF1934 domain-containing protein [Virgibacillus sp. W0181]|uniref:DUF1934 domain-containing protein n=1 Tax=Virgibacillus sp. W0181 TaxID=3391581 RepID=UPI003F47CFF5
MNRTEKKVKIKLHTVIDDNEGKEHNHIAAEGTFYQRGSTGVLTFEEKNDNNETIKNFITIHSEKVNVKRSGAITMNQQFRLHRKTESQFQHPFGQIGMETMTHTLAYEPLDQTKSGQLFISYTVKLNGETERAHQLKLIFTEEETH